jgi:hypothetical protein
MIYKHFFIFTSVRHALRHDKVSCKSFAEKRKAIKSGSCSMPKQHVVQIDHATCLLSNRE